VISTDRCPKCEAYLNRDNPRWWYCGSLVDGSKQSDICRAREKEYRESPEGLGERAVELEKILKELKGLFVDGGNYMGIYEEAAKRLCRHMGWENDR